MENEKKLAMLEDIMDLEEGALQEDLSLEELDEWDSLSVLSFISMMDEEYNKTVTGAEVKALKTVGDLIALMK